MQPTPAARKLHKAACKQACATQALAFCASRVQPKFSALRQAALRPESPSA